MGKTGDKLRWISEQNLLKLGKPCPSLSKKLKKIIFDLEFTVAERKAFLTKQTLTYKARVGIYDDTKEVRFFEILKESGAGVSSGDIDGISPGFGFKVEKVRLGLDGTRHGTIKEQSTLFSKKYQYNFNFERIRELVENAAEESGFKFKYVLNERNI